MLQRMLYLRYGTTKPEKNSKPEAILSMSLISEMMKVPLGTLTWMDRKYFTS